MPVILSRYQSATSKLLVYGLLHTQFLLSSNTLLCPRNFYELVILCVVLLCPNNLVHCYRNVRETQWTPNDKPKARCLWPTYRLTSVSVNTPSNSSPTHSVGDVMWCGVMSCDTHSKISWSHFSRRGEFTVFPYSCGFIYQKISRYYHTRTNLGGVVVNSSNSNILDAQWEITLLLKGQNRSGGVLKGRSTAADSAKAFKLCQTLF